MIRTWQEAATLWAAIEDNCIVKDYGGEIQIDSTPGRGATFRLSFAAAA